MKPVWWIAVLAGAAGAQSPPADRDDILDEARAAALHYSQWLPNLICTEFIRRDISQGAANHWNFVDTLTAQVTYFDRKESYQLVAHNQHSAHQRLENMAGAISKGEFGSMLRWIFEPEARAEFEWQTAGTVHRRPVQVFAYRVDASNSRLELAALSHSAFPPFHGRVSIDALTSQVLRVTAEVDMPENFPIRESSIEIEYDWSEINGTRYLVPVRAEARMAENLAVPVPRSAPRGSASPPLSCVSCDPRPAVAERGPAVILTRYRNRIEFRNYRKFTTDSTLKFETDAQRQKVK